MPGFIPRGSSRSVRASVLPKPKPSATGAPKNASSAPLQRYGTAPRAATPQGQYFVTRGDFHTLQTQILYPRPTTLHLKSSTARPSYTKPYGSAQIDTHAGTQTGARVLRPHGGPPPSPLFLGSRLGLGKTTVRVPVVAPPQTLIPNVMKKLFTR